MGAITATSAVIGLLEGLTATTEIQDASGNVLGFYTPVAEQDRQMRERALQNIDFEEIKRRAASAGPYYTTEQVIAHCQSLGSH